MPNLKFILPLAVCTCLAGCYDSTPKFSGNLGYDSSEFDEDSTLVDSNSVSYQEPAQEEASTAGGDAATVNTATKDPNGLEAEEVEVVADASNDFQPGTSSPHFVNMLRIWKDSKGEFSTKAELMAVATMTREVRLLKQNGVAITVPYAILSDHDKNFVTEFINAERQRAARPAPQLVEVFDN